MNYLVIVLAAITTASAMAAPNAQPESLEKRACYTAVSMTRKLTLSYKSG